MRVLRNGSLAGLALAALGTLILGPAPAAQGPAGRRAAFAASAPQSLRQWDSAAQSMLRSGELRIRQVRDDTQIDGRTNDRADQYHRGVRVFGADISRQMDSQGVVLSMFGTVYSGIDIGVDPRLSSTDVKERVAALAGTEQGAGSPDPELVVLPSDDAAAFHLAWRVRAVTASADIIQYFLDARSGDVLMQYSDRQTQAAVGRALGVLGDNKKISVTSGSGAAAGFSLTDRLRPPVIETNDMKGSPTRTLDYLNGRIALNAGDIAADDDNNWTDGAVDDAHVYSGYTYDYYFKRFGRKGLNDNNVRIRSLANPVRRTQADLLLYFNQLPDFFVNAFYAGGGNMVYGVGLPPGFTLSGQSWNHLSGALDVVAHELTHGVTEFTSNLIYRNESGALNEAFSDMMGTSVEFFFQPAGNGDLKADYLLGEDVVKTGGLRSMENPQAYDDRDHYSRRFLGSADNGGVHINSGIANQAFYLAIEGGTNRTSGLAVQGVGAANREQIEKVFYRAFTTLLPSDATFAQARAATIQAARDLFGNNNSNAERAVTQAWTAVGVN